MQSCPYEGEPGVCADVAGRRTYGEYLRLSQLLAAQVPQSDPSVHDEFLFIVHHQICELWLKLLIHEIRAGMAALEVDDLPRCMKALARGRLIQKQLTGMWEVLDSMTPTDFAAFRPVLGQASGLQSHQYRTLEVLLGTRLASRAGVFRHDVDAYAALRADLEAPSLWDQVLRLLGRRGFCLPVRVLERDFSQPYTPASEVLDVVRNIYKSPGVNQDLVELFERLVDAEEEFQVWRFKHLRTVNRFIGERAGTGGSSGGEFLKKTLELSFFPELYQVRSEL